MIATKPVDFRKQHDGLFGHVKSVLRKDPFTGTVFAFRTKGADRLKLPVGGTSDLPSLSLGPEVGVVAVFGLTADRNGLTDIPILRAFRWVLDCFGSAGS